MSSNSNSLTPRDLGLSGLLILIVLVSCTLSWATKENNPIVSGTLFGLAFFVFLVAVRTLRSVMPPRAFSALVMSVAVALMCVGIYEYLHTDNRTSALFLTILAAVSIFGNGLDFKNSDRPAAKE